MSATTTRQITAKEITSKIGDLQTELNGESDPNRRAALSRSITALQKQANVSAADRKATAAGNRRKATPVTKAQSARKPAAKKSAPKAAAAKPAAKKSAPARKPAAAKTENASQPLVWQGRLDQAVKAMSVKKNQGVGVITTCPTPKTATGTADKVRKLLAAGRIETSAQIRVKSQGANVVCLSA